jgi:polar amino acid transport system substrate-binding protein
VKFIFTQQKFSVACNPAFPDALLQQMQAALDKLIENGTQAMILEKYGLKSANIGVAAATP